MKKQTILDKNTLKRVTEIIREVSIEADVPETAIKNLNHDTSLEKDLGLDSLAAVEIVGRVQESFGVALEPEIFLSVDTPGELAQAISGSDILETPRMPPKEPQTGESTPSAPEQAKTFLEAIVWRARNEGHLTHIQFYEEAGDGERLSYEMLYEQGSKIAAGLRKIGIRRGDRVAIMLPTCADYFFVFTGVLIAGAVPVPVYPPMKKSQLRDHALRHIGIFQNCSAKLLVTSDEILPLADFIRTRSPKLRHVRTPKDLSTNKNHAERIQPRPEDLALIQYTSGSTGDPKGVMLTHKQLLANIRQIGNGLNVASNEVVVSWLPLYHDMGLIGAWMCSLFYGAKLVLLSPMDFVANPLSWLRAIHRYGGTIATAPNFAYELCVKKHNPETLRGLDLSTWRAALNGAEPVSPDTLEKFLKTYAAYGFRRSAFMPVYGLAENAVALSFPPVGRGPLIRRFDREKLTKQKIADSGGKGGIKLASAGSPLPGNQIRVVDEAGRPLEENLLGEIEFRGDSSTDGYYRSPEKNQELFDDGWLRSGDLGFFSDGELYISGRKKDMIIKAGRNIFPQELEEKVGDLSGIRKGCVAVFSSKKNDATEMLIVVAESVEKRKETRDQLVAKIRSLSMELLDTSCDEVVLVAPHTVLKTSSGKIRRAATRELYEQGKLTSKKKPESSNALFNLELARGKAGKKLYAWTILASNALYTFYFFTLMAVICAPTILWIKLAPFKLKWKGVAFATRTFFLLTLTKVDIEGLRFLPAEDDKCVIVANHQSFLDGAVLSLLGRPLVFMAKAGLQKHFLTNMVLRPLGTIFVERKNTEDALAKLSEAQTILSDEKNTLCFFPEGAIQHPGNLSRFHMGAFILATRQNARIVPVSIEGSAQALGSADFWRPKPLMHISLKAHPPLSAGDKDQSKEWKEAVRLRDLVKRQIRLDLEGNSIL